MKSSGSKVGWEKKRGIGIREEGGMWIGEMGMRMRMWMRRDGRDWNRLGKKLDQKENTYLGSM